MGKLKMSFHVVGVSAVILCLAFMPYVFSTMLIQGYFLATEPNKPILLYEVALSLIAFIYGLYLLIPKLKVLTK